MSAPEIIFSNIYDENKSKLLRPKTVWQQDSFILYIIEKNAAWFAIVSAEHMEMLADQHELDKNSYYLNVKEYIRNSSSNTNAELKNNQCIIYRSSTKEKLKLKYFFVKLNKVDYQSTIESFLDDFALKYKELLSKVDMLEQEKVELQNQKSVIENYCTELSELKRKSDLKMYSAFMLLLNEKKHRIRYLTEVLEEYTGNRRERVKVQSVQSNAVAEVSDKQETHSDPESSDGYNTDDEKKLKSKQVEAVPSTSTDNYDFLGSESPPPVVRKRVKLNNCIANISESKELNLASKEVVKAIDPKYDAETDEEDCEVNIDDLLDRM
ncbi:hypothetical protein FQA39_LY16567 [Lamprigera yunnana]|nr:hypothetical protein FQA39_LY16567 [Lamprigera yunnana]